MADGGGRIEGAFEKFFAGDFTGSIFAPGSPDDGAGSDQFAVVPAVQHRST
jgi:hypothetical protein